LCHVEFVANPTWNATISPTSQQLLNANITSGTDGGTKKYQDKKQAKFAGINAVFHFTLIYAAGREQVTDMPLVSFSSLSAIPACGQQGLEFPLNT